MAKKKLDAAVSMSTAVEENTAAVSIEDNADIKTNITKKAGESMRKDDIELLSDGEEIPVESIIPNVSYKDKRTGNVYEWEDSGHVEYMTVEEIGNLWRASKGYFKNLWLYPKDQRILKKYRLEKTYSDFEFLISSPSYIQDNIEEIRCYLRKASVQLKFTILGRIKSFIANGDLTDIVVIRELEKEFGTQLI